VGNAPDQAIRKDGTGRRAVAAGGHPTGERGLWTFSLPPPVGPLGLRAGARRGAVLHPGRPVLTVLCAAFLPHESPHDSLAQILYSAFSAMWLNSSKQRIEYKGSSKLM
jgi:hypothetical protein